VQSSKQRNRASGGGSSSSSSSGCSSSGSNTDGRKSGGDLNPKKSDTEVEFDLNKLLLALEGDVQHGAGNPSFNAALKRLGAENTELLPDSDSDCGEDHKQGRTEQDDEDEGEEDEGDEGDDCDIDEIDQENNNLRMLMHAMDQELQHQGIGKEFERVPKSDSKKGQVEVGEEEFHPVEVNLNLVKNLLESYSAQAGEAGPVGNLLCQLGLSLPSDLTNDLD